MRSGVGSALMSADDHHGVSFHSDLDSWMRSVHDRKVDAYIGTISKFDEWPWRNVCIFLTSWNL